MRCFLRLTSTNTFSCNLFMACSKLMHLFDSGTNKKRKSLQLGLWYSCCREPESNVPAIHHQSPWRREEYERKIKKSKGIMSWWLCLLESVESNSTWTRRQKHRKILKEWGHSSSPNYNWNCWNEWNVGLWRNMDGSHAVNGLSGARIGFSQQGSDKIEGTTQNQKI